MTNALKMNKLGGKFASLCRNLQGQITDIQLKSTSSMGFACLNYIWYQSHREHKRDLEAALHLGYLAGNAFNRGATALNYPYCLIEADMEEILAANRKMVHILEESKLDSFLDTALAQDARIANLLGRTESAYSYTLPHLHERDMRRKALAKRNLNGYAGHCATKVETLALREKWRAASQYSFVASRFLTAILGTRYEMMFRFYKILALTQHIRQKRRWPCLYYHMQIAWERWIIHGWYQTNPESFQYLKALVDAEVCALYGKNPMKVLKMFEEAIAASKRYSRAQIGVAYHRAALFARGHGLAKIADQYLRESVFYYEHCKMYGVANSLRKKYAMGHGENQEATATYRDPCLPPIPQTAGIFALNTAESLTTGINLDIATLFKTHQLISQEVRLERMSEILLERLMENTGATRAQVILKEPDDSFMIHAKLDQDKKVNLGSEDLDHASDLPKDVIAFALRSKTTVMVEDFNASHEFSHDPYLKKTKTGSLLVVPINHQSGLIGVLYLENTMTTQFFSFDRIQMVELLAGQLAISIEHARIYQNLEELALQRSGEIKSMLENIALGIMVIYGNKLQIHPEYSVYMETILGQGNLMNMPVMELLFDRTDLTSTAKENLEQQLWRLFGLSMNEFQKAVHLLPHELTYRHAGAERVLQLQWGCIRDPNEAVEKLLISVCDITQTRKLQAEVDQQQLRLAIISQVLDVPQDKRMGFFKEALRELDSCLNLAKNEPGQAKNPIAKRLENLGEWATDLGFSYLANALQRAARETKEHCAAKDISWLNACQGAIDETRRIIDEYWRVSAQHHSGAGDIWPLTRLAQIQQCFFDYKKQGGIRAEVCWGQLVDIVFPHLKGALAPVTDGLKDMAAMLEKPTPQLFFLEDSFRYPDAVAKVLRDVFLHLLRNSLDHGIEPPAERKASGKPPQGAITVASYTSGDNLQIRYTDEGRGIRLEEIHARALKMGLISQANAMAPYQEVNLLFLDGFSTKDNVTAISGRGMGMAAIRSILEKIGAHIQIVAGEKNPLGYHPLTFYLSIPLHLIIREERQKAA